MRISLFGAFALGGTISIALLAGCSGSSQQGSMVPGSPSTFESIGRQHLAASTIARQRPTVSAVERAGTGFFAPVALLLGGGLIEDAKSASVLYVGQFSSTFINAYAIPDPKNKPPTCEVSPVSSMNGMGVNALHDVYDPDAGTRSLIVYAPKCGAALSTVAIPGGVQDSDVAFNEKAKTAWVDLTSPAGVIPIKYGAKSFGTELTCAALSESFGVGVDGKGNVYASGTTGSAGIIVEWVGGKGACKTLGATGLSFPGGIEFDSKENLVVEDIQGGLIDIFKPPYKGAATRTITPKGQPVYGKLDSTDTNLYVSNSTAGSADVYTYATGKYTYSITSGLSQANTVEGIGVDPP